jgi:hypothetical protein
MPPTITTGKNGIFMVPIPSKIITMPPYMKQLIARMPRTSFILAPLEGKTANHMVAANPTNTAAIPPRYILGSPGKKPSFFYWTLSLSKKISQLKQRGNARASIVNVNERITAMPAQGVASPFKRPIEGERPTRGHGRPIT